MIPCSQGNKMIFNFASKIFKVFDTLCGKPVCHFLPHCAVDA